jgi:Mg-chelatase subunit ChlI
MVEKVTYTRRDLLSIAALTASLNVDGHRADLVILKAARAHAAYEERSAITDRDIALAAELALPHRIKHGPFQQSEISPEQLQERIEQLQGSSSDGEPSEEPQKEPDATDVKKKS